MAQTTRTFRIFVSSTFSDLKEERNALQKYVFPRLRELCTQHGCRFQAIDLRWGVRDEAGLDQQTMKICLDEVSRSQRTSPRPNFIVLLGDRYGWRPLPAEIPAREFEYILERVTPDEKELLLWTDQQPEDKKGWYRRDDNARFKRDEHSESEPIYCLQPRGGRFAEFNVWETEVERPLHAILLRAIEGLDLTEAERRKYEASATEQEIAAGALSIPDAPEHVFCYFRTIRNLPHDRVAKDFVDVKQDYALDAAAVEKLELLKASLESKLPGNIYPYVAEWRDAGDVSLQPINQRCESVLEALAQDIAGMTGERKVSQLDDEVWERLARLGDQTLEASVADEGEPEPSATQSPITLDHVPKLCTEVYLALARVILGEIARLEEVEPLKKEIDDHDAFGENRAKSFIGRRSILKTILDYVGRNDRRPLAVWGESGSGKSALMAKAIEECRSRMPGHQIVSRFIGATPASSDGRSLLESLCRQVTRIYDGDEGTIPADYRELAKEFGERLKLATAQKPLLVFLDALDQLSDADHARNLIWLPGELPEHVRLVVSTLPGECKTALERKLRSEDLVKLEPMPREEADELLEAWLTEAGKTLQSDQREEVLQKFEASSKATVEGNGKASVEEGGMPLYLKLAFEEARRWKSYSPAVELEGSIPGIIRQLFGRLSLDTNHGSVLVSRSLGYIAAAKNGLSEDELLDVLACDSDVYANFLKVSHHIPSDLLPHLNAHLRDMGETMTAEDWLKSLYGDEGRLVAFVGQMLERAPDLQLPVVLWSRLYFDLEPYLTERSADGASLMSFYHRQLREVVEAEFLTGNDKPARHAHLANYFGRQELFEPQKKTPNVRKLSELPYQQTYAGQWDAVHATLTDFDFLEAKLTHVAVITSGRGEDAKTIYGGVYELQEDYRRALDSWGGDPGAGRTGPRPRHPLIITAWVSPVDQSHAVGCPLCRVWSEIPASALGSEIACPHCEGPLKVNPFTINSDWRPVAEAWRK
jgi:hypothetical protein